VESIQAFCSTEKGRLRKILQKWNKEAHRPSTVSIEDDGLLPDRNAIRLVEMLKNQQNILEMRDEINEHIDFLLASEGSLAEELENLKTKLQRAWDQEQHIQQQLEQESKQRQRLQLQIIQAEQNLEKVRLDLEIWNDQLTAISSSDLYSTTY
jgi:chromosome segregation ATPase